MTVSYQTRPVVNPTVGVPTNAKQELMYLPGTKCPLKSQVKLAALTSFRVGGPAEWYVSPKNFEELKQSFAWATEQELPITLLGAGSNLLVSDRGLPGLVIGTKGLRHTHFDPNTGQVRVAAGQSIARLAWKAAALGWEGLEWAVGIPGTVGGAVVMNAGAHGSCAADILVDTQLLSPNGTVELLTPADLGYRYRTSVLQRGSRLVTEATFQLKPGADPAKVTATTAEQLEQRRLTQPYHLPSCGSVFRNPKGEHGAGWLIENMGLKGYQIGAAQVAERHANFILNCGGAKAMDIYQLIEYLQEQVEHHWSVNLEPEVRVLGQFTA
jgi:UDP-N-acetylmuramate dehydrogenase